MPQTFGVRVELSYKTIDGELAAGNYPKELSFPELIFAEQVTSIFLMERLGNITFSDGLEISYTAFDVFDERRLH